MKLQDIARVLAERKQLQDSVAMTFATTMFDVIREALGRDRIVKVKGLGTFKVVEVNARESVNVNSGERVTIESHSKITFTPDAVMRDIVNKPFSQFETVVLNDGVEFDDLLPAEEANIAEPDVADDGTYPYEPAEEETSPSADSSEEVQTESMEEDADEESSSAIDVAPAVTDVFGDAGVEVPAEEAEAANCHADETVQPAVDAAMEDCDDHIEPVETESDGQSLDERPDAEADLETEDEAASAEDEEQEVLPDAEEDDELSDGEEEEELAGDAPTAATQSDKDGHGKRGGVLVGILLSVVAIVLLGMAAFCGFLYGRYTSGDTIYIASFVLNPDAPDEQAAPMPVPAQRDTTATAAESVAKDTVATVEEKPDAKEEKVSQTKTKSEKPAFDSSVYEQMDARVRTGAYRIVGTDRIVTVKQGETLKKISDRLLGSGMECYVEVYNGLNSSSQLQAGQKLKIPKLQLKKRK